MLNFFPCMMWKIVCFIVRIAPTQFMIDILTYIDQSEKCGFFGRTREDASLYCCQSSEEAVGNVKIFILTDKESRIEVRKTDYLHDNVSSPSQLIGSRVSIWGTRASKSSSLYFLEDRVINLRLNIIRKIRMSISTVYFHSESTRSDIQFKTLSRIENKCM